MAAGGILVVEDEALIGMDIQMTLEDGGFADVQVCSSLRTALERIEARAPDVAFLDLNLGSGQTSIPIAERLMEIGKPFVFLSGYSGANVDIPEAMGDVERLSKPVREAEVLAVAQRTLSVTSTA